MYDCMKPSVKAVGYLTTKAELTSEWASYQVTHGDGPLDFFIGVQDITRFPLKGAPKVKEVLAKNVPYAREAPKINFDRVFIQRQKLGRN